MDGKADPYARKLELSHRVYKQYCRVISRRLSTRSRATDNASGRRFFRETRIHATRIHGMLRDYRSTHRKCYWVLPWKMVWARFFGKIRRLVWTLKNRA